MTPAAHTQWPFAAWQERGKGGGRGRGGSIPSQHCAGTTKGAVMGTQLCYGGGGRGRGARNGFRQRVGVCGGGGSNCAVSAPESRIPHASSRSLHTASRTSLPALYVPQPGGGPKHLLSSHRSTGEDKTRRLSARGGSARRPARQAPQKAEQRGAARRRGGSAAGPPSREQRGEAGGGRGGGGRRSGGERLGPRGSGVAPQLGQRRGRIPPEQRRSVAEGSAGSVGLRVPQRTRGDGAPLVPLQLELLPPALGLLPGAVLLRGDGVRAERGGERRREGGPGCVTCTALRKRPAKPCSTAHSSRSAPGAASSQ